MCLIAQDNPQPPPLEDDFLEFLFDSLAQYRHYKETGEVEEGMQVIEQENSLSFRRIDPVCR